MITASDCGRKLWQTCFSRSSKCRHHLRLGRLNWQRHFLLLPIPSSLLTPSLLYRWHNVPYAPNRHTCVIRDGLWRFLLRSTVGLFWLLLEKLQRLFPPRPYLMIFILARIYERQKETWSSADGATFTKSYSSQSSIFRLVDLST